VDHQVLFPLICIWDSHCADLYCFATQVEGAFSMWHTLWENCCDAIWSMKLVHTLWESRIGQSKVTY
jgi:hypothetical protein